VSEYPLIQVTQGKSQPEKQNDLRSASAARFPALPGGQTSPHANEIQVAHCVGEALAAYWAAGTQSSSVRQVLQVGGEEWASFSLAGRLLKPVEQTVRTPDTDSSLRMLNGRPLNSG